MLCFHPMKTNHAMQLTNLNWNCFEGRQTKKHTKPEFEKKKLVWIIGHETKSTKIIRPVLGKKLVSGRAVRGRTGSRRSAWNWV